MQINALAVTNPARAFVHMHNIGSIRASDLLPTGYHAKDQAKADLAILHS